MKLLYSSSNALVVTHLRNLLESSGVASQIKNEFLYSAAGEIPPTAIWPELWVDETDFEQARVIMEEAMADKSSLPSWRCEKCGEQVEGQFDICWQCGRPRPEAGN